jgi:hypothetical protein
MKSWKIVVVALAAVGTSSLAMAAEGSGTLNLAAPGTCPLTASAPSAPLPLLLPVSLTGDSSPSSTCGQCSQSVCVGKSVNSFCIDLHHLCQAGSFCPKSNAPQCLCASPP